MHVFLVRELCEVEVVGGSGKNCVKRSYKNARPPSWEEEIRREDEKIENEPVIFVETTHFYESYVLKQWGRGTSDRSRIATNRSMCVHFRT